MNNEAKGKAGENAEDLDGASLGHICSEDGLAPSPTREALQRALEESRQRQNEISAVLEASHALLSLGEFEPAARAIFDSCKRLIGATAGYVALLSADGTENEVLFLDSGGADCSVDPSLAMPIRGLREKVYRTGQTVFESDFRETEWASFIPSGHAPINNVLFAPLKINRIVVGLLGLANKPGGFSEDDVRLAITFAELAAIALLNSRTIEALQHSEERFRAVAQTAGDAIITVDSFGNIVFWNKAAETMFSYRAVEAIGQSLSIIMPERLRAAHETGMKRLVSTGEPRILGKTVEMVGLRRDGGEFPVELSLSTWEIKGDVFFTGIVRDVTERVRVEHEIESLAKFPSENPFPVLRVLHDGTIRYANAASASLLAQWATKVEQKAPEALRALVADALRSGANFTATVPVGERIVSLDLAPVPEAGYVNLYGRDVTEQVRAEESLREQNQFIINVLEALNHPFYVVDADDYTIRMANSAACGDELPESVTCHALTHRRSIPCEGAGHLCPLEEIKKTGKPVTVEHIHYDRDGERRIFEVHGHPILDGAGKATQIIEYTLDVTKRRRAEEALRERTHELGERVKELNCLYGISALVEKPGLSLAEILQGTVDLIPPAWQYPEIAGARVILNGQEFKTERFSETAFWQQTANIIMYRKPVGRVDVCYLEERPPSDEGPFLQEERDLIDAIAERLGEIAERVRAEAAVRESEATARALLNAPTDIAALIDTGGMILGANETMAERFSTSVDALVGTCVWDLFSLDVVARRKAKVEQVVRSSKPQRYEDWREGIWNDNVLYPVLDENGEVDKIAVIARDITARKRAEEALQKAHDELELRVQQRTAQLAEANLDLQAEVAQHKQTAATLAESEDRYRHLVEAAFEAMAIHSDGKIVDINPAGASLLGACAAEELVGRSIREFVRPDFWNMIQEWTQQAKKKRKAVRRTEETLLRLDGSRVDVEAAAIATIYQGRPAMQLVFHDLTARRRVEREKERIARDLHDSLGHSLGYLHLKLDHLAGSDAVEDVEELRRELARMRDVANEAYELVRGMLAALLPSGSADLARAMQEQAQRIGERGGFEVCMSSEGRSRRLDPVLQQQVLYLFQEALVNVERHAQARQVHIELLWADDTLTIIMTDDGCGFEMDTLQTQGHYGLQVMRERATGIEGSLTLSSRPGVGTKVKLQLPLVSSRQRGRER